jgi:hypothetical protein
MTYQKDAEKAVTEFAEKQEQQILTAFNIKIKAGGPTRNAIDLTKYKFKCPLCGKTKQAPQAVRLLSPLKITQQPTGNAITVTVSQKQLIACRECVNKIPCSEPEP